eukprot:scaffold169859_cov33-Tisochrysis_lutea.AAC.8
MTRLRPSNVPGSSHAYSDAWNDMSANARAQPVARDDGHGRGVCTKALARQPPGAPRLEEGPPSLKLCSKVPKQMAVAVRKRVYQLMGEGMHHRKLLAAPLHACATG